jgi:laminin alpha 3/5
VEFKTTDKDGIILYVADARHVDFVALYLKDGYVVYGYNLGDDAARISSTDTYNDGQWHTVRSLLTVSFSLFETK